MTKVLSGSLASGFISGNSSTLSLNAPVDVLKANSLRINNVTRLSKCGYNGFLMVYNGKVYTCAGNQGTYNTYANGRGNQYPLNMGYDSLRVVAFPNETGPIVDSNNNGYTVAYALFGNGNLYTWGYNNYGQVGIGPEYHVNSGFNRGPDSRTETVRHPICLTKEVYFNGYRVVDIATMQESSFALTEDGTLWAWGRNNYGQLGFPTSSSFISTDRSYAPFAIPINWATYGGIQKFFCSSYENSDWLIVLDGQGHVWTAGYNNNGQLGLGNTTNYSSPKQVGALSTWGKLMQNSPSASHTLALIY